ncbi:hypothetical protein [Aquisphaera insulae]|uniref:hypothetical protein n=1 Tax=Aquisphaera insulae TaxID=2712864 RepID=UPI0013ED42F9|nr:hypothetical protein [Aquisphaera insulae]
MSNPRLAARLTIPIVGAACTTFFFLALSVVMPGCGGGSPEFDKAALYTPESLAAELAFRYQELNPDARVASKNLKFSKKLAEDVARTAKVEKKGAGAKKKQTGPRTIDDVLQDVNGKLSQIQGVSRADACKKMTETIAKNASLGEADRKALTDLVGRMANPE